MAPIEVKAHSAKDKDSIVSISTAPGADDRDKLMAAKLPTDALLFTLPTANWMEAGVVGVAAEVLCNVVNEGAMAISLRFSNK